MSQVSPDDAIAVVFQLPLERRVQLVEGLMRTIAEDTEKVGDFALSDEQVAELDRRMAELDADPSIGLSHEEVWSRLRNRDGA